MLIVGAFEVVRGQLQTDGLSSVWRCRVTSTRRMAIVSHMPFSKSTRIKLATTIITHGPTQNVLVNLDTSVDKECLKFRHAKPRLDFVGRETNHKINNAFASCIFFGSILLEETIVIVAVASRPMMMNGKKAKRTKCEFKIKN